jgi:hypothetical protein
MNADFVQAGREIRDDLANVYVSFGYAANGTLPAIRVRGGNGLKAEQLRALTGPSATGSGNEYVVVGGLKQLMTKFSPATQEAVRATAKYSHPEASEDRKLVKAIELNLQALEA